MLLQNLSNNHFSSCKIFHPGAVSEFSLALPHCWTLKQFSIWGYLNSYFSKQFDTSISHSPLQLPNLFHSLEVSWWSSFLFTWFKCTWHLSFLLTRKQWLSSGCLIPSHHPTISYSFHSLAPFVLSFHQACPGPPCRDKSLLPLWIFMRWFFCLEQSSLPPAPGNFSQALDWETSLLCKVTPGLEGGEGDFLWEMYINGLVWLCARGEGDQSLPRWRSWGSLWVPEAGRVPESVCCCAELGSRWLTSQLCHVLTLTLCMLLNTSFFICTRIDDILWFGADPQS